MWLYYDHPSHAKNQAPELYLACRSGTGYLKPTNVEFMYFLSGVIPLYKGENNQCIYNYRPISVFEIYEHIVIVNM